MIRERATIFDFIKGLTEKKKSWSSFSQEDRKSFSKYMINRWLSMNYDLVEFVNELQQNTYILKDELVYDLYYGVLPEQRMFFKYVKSKSQPKYEQSLLEYLVMYYSISKSQAVEYLEIFYKTPDGIEQVEDILRKYGVDQKIIKKIMQIK